MRWDGLVDDICRVYIRSSRVVRAPDYQCQSRNSPGFGLSILRHTGISGTADESVLKKVHKKKSQKFPKNPPLFPSGLFKSKSLTKGAFSFLNKLKPYVKRFATKLLTNLRVSKNTESLWGKKLNISEFDVKFTVYSVRYALRLWDGINKRLVLLGSCWPLPRLRLSQPEPACVRCWVIH